MRKIKQATPEVARRYRGRASAMQEVVDDYGGKRQKQRDEMREAVQEMREKIRHAALAKTPPAGRTG